MNVWIVVVLVIATSLIILPPSPWQHLLNGFGIIL